MLFSALRVPARAAALAVVVLMGVLGCSDDDSSSDTTTTATVETTEAETTEAETSTTSAPATETGGPWTYSTEDTADGERVSATVASTDGRASLEISEDPVFGTTVVLRVEGVTFDPALDRLTTISIDGGAPMEVVNSLPEGEPRLSLNQIEDLRDPFLAASTVTVTFPTVDGEGSAEFAVEGADPEQVPEFP